MNEGNDHLRPAPYRFPFIIQAEINWTKIDVIQIDIFSLKFLRIVFTFLMMCATDKKCFSLKEVIAPQSSILMPETETISDIFTEVATSVFLKDET